MAASPIGTVLGGTLSPGATIVPGVGYVVVDVGQNVYKALADAPTALGCRLGICVNAPAAPGVAMQVQVNGALPYWLWNLGGGNASAVIAGTTPARGYAGQVIGVCDTSGSIVLVDSYLGLPGQGGASMLGVLGGIALNTAFPTVGQALVFDGTRWTPANVLVPGNLKVVRVNTNGSSGAQASPYQASPGDYVVVDSSQGNVTVLSPVLALSQAFTVHQDEATSLASASVTVTGAAGRELALPPPNNGSFTNSGGGHSYTFTGAQYEGTTLAWFNGGSSGGYLLQ